MATKTPSPLDGLLSPQRLCQFTLVGVAGATFDMGILALLYGWAGVALLPAKAWAAETGIVVAFVLNEVWTFAGEGVESVRARLKRFLTSNAIRVFGMVVATAVLLILARWFHVWYVLANAIGLATGGVVNYAFEALYAWRIHE